MTPDELRDAVLLEAHRAIADATRHAVELAEAGGPGVVVRPWAPTELTGAESAALRALPWSPTLRAALAKVVTEGANAAVFRWLAVLDGVGDPEDRSPDALWLGARLVERGDEDAPMLHDEFWEVYWKLHGAQ